MLCGYNVRPIVVTDKDNEGRAIVGKATDHRCLGQNGGWRGSADGADTISGRLLLQTRTMREGLLLDAPWIQCRANCCCGQGR